MNAPLDEVGSENAAFFDIIAIFSLLVHFTKGHIAPIAQHKNHRALVSKDTPLSLLLNKVRFTRNYGKFGFQVSKVAVGYKIYFCIHSLKT